MPGRPDDHILPALSVPTEVHDPAGASRRRFLQGLLATGGAATLGPLLPAWLPGGEAFAASPVAPHEGILVTVLLDGGNDGLNTVVPTGRGAYYDRRGKLAIPTSRAIPIATGVGLHPRLPKLAARYRAGTVAIVQGAGQPAADLSHFWSTATWMAGTAGTARSTGWLGRWVDGLPEAESGMRGVTIGASIPLAMIGSRAVVTALPEHGPMWGHDRSAGWENRILDVVASYGAGSSGVGPWGDAVAVATRGALDSARDLAPVHGAGMPAPGFGRQMVLAARLVNLDLGIRVINTRVSGFDTHANQPATHARLLGELDAGIDSLFATIGSAWRRQVTVLIYSEFGRRVEPNASNGTDHGTANDMLLVGDRVRGGLHGQQSSLTKLDTWGNLVPRVDFRQVYASVLDQHLGGGSSDVLGATYATLPLFRP
jgi:uncharacterized protein (DUF1501 family)